MLERITVATDGSDASVTALRLAFALAVPGDTAVHVLHIIDDELVTAAFSVTQYTPSVYLEWARRSGAVIVDEAAKLARAAGVAATCELVESNGRTVAGTIIARARRHGARLLILGTHGRRGIARVLMGSTAEEVVRRASIPVMLVHATQPKRRARRRSPQTRVSSGALSESAAHRTSARMAAKPARASTRHET
jgi:nucleotide-binding universal stress UspA family protein